MREQDPETYEVLGACFAVHSEKGCGFNELVYHECLGIEFELRRVPYERGKELLLAYKGRPLSQRFYADFVCYSRVLLECKAVDRIIDKHRAQTLNYMKAGGIGKGLLVNFGDTSLQYERFVL